MKKYFARILEIFSFLKPRKADAEKIPVTVFTGFLGSGKTTIIINLVKQLPTDYKVVILKNEFGDQKIDSVLAAESNIRVTEMLNGCLCCVLVGKLHYALEEILEKYTPDRIIIETSGSAYPAPIAWEIRKMQDKLKLDGIVTVIDAVNFPGYKDKSFTAKLQAEFTDLILINKHEEISEPDLDKVLDDVYELNPHTPKLKTAAGVVAPDVIFGIDTKLFTLLEDVNIASEKNDHEHHREVEVENIHFPNSLVREDFEKLLQKLPKWDFYRIKGILNLDGKVFFLNYTFGKWNYTALNNPSLKNSELVGNLVLMGKNLRQNLSGFEELGAKVTTTVRVV